MHGLDYMGGGDRPPNPPTLAAAPAKPWRRSFNRQLLARLPWFAGGVLVALVLTAALASVVAPQSPTAGDITQKLIPPVWMERGDPAHPLGTDRFGRDVL